MLQSKSKDLPIGSLGTNIGAQRTANSALHDWMVGESGAWCGVLAPSTQCLACHAYALCDNIPTPYPCTTTTWYNIAELKHFHFSVLAVK